MPMILRAAADEAELLIYDSIGESFWGDGVTAKGFDKDLKALGGRNRITVRINSGGGDVFDGLAIYNTLARHSARKTVYVDGLAASAASVIAMAGDEIVMGAGTFLMIHNAWTMAVGSSDDMRRAADLLDSISGQMADIYVKRTGAPAAKVREMMNAETWMSPDDAVKNGFADRRSDDTVKAAASIDARAFRNLPPALRSSLRGQVLHLDAWRPAPAAPGPKLAALREKIAASRR